jgi:hypothetical protein
MSVTRPAAVTRPTVVPTVTARTVMTRCRCVRCGIRYLSTPVSAPDPPTSSVAGSTVLSVCGCCAEQLVLFPSLVPSLGVVRVRDVRGRFVADTAAGVAVGGGW